MDELINLRGENSKTFDLGGNKYRLEIGGAHAHYKDNYTDAKEQWKEVDLTIVDNKITKAPYILEIDGDKYTITDKKTGKVSVVEKLDKDTNFKLIPGIHTIRFQTVINKEKDLKDLQYKISGDIPVVYSAYDADGEPLELEISKNKDIVTEKLKTNEVVIKYPVRIDPTLTVQGTGQDTYIHSSESTTNYGTSTDIDIYNYSDVYLFGLVSLPVSELPAGATQTSATFSMYYRGYEYGDPNGNTLRAYLLRRNDWVDSQATWAIYKTGNNWGTAGAANTSTDINTSYVDTQTVPASAGWVNFDVLDFTQYAVTNSVNFNARIESTTNEFGIIHFYSENYATDTTKRPKLVIVYTTAALGQILVTM